MDPFNLVHVIIRKFPNGGDFVALFPREVANAWPQHCLAYYQLGQHSSAVPDAVIRATVPATGEEVFRFLPELERVGYRFLKVRARFHRSDFRERQRRLVTGE